MKFLNSFCCVLYAVMLVRHLSFVFCGEALKKCESMIVCHIVPTGVPSCCHTLADRIVKQELDSILCRLKFKTLQKP